MAARFWVGQSGGGNYNSTDWALTTGGTTGQAAPTSSDDVTFDGAGTFGNTNCTITAGASALSVTFTSGYTATLTINSNLTWTVSGNFTDNTAHGYSLLGTQNAGQLTINAASTITSGGKTFPGNVTFSNSNIKTLSGNWTISGTLTASTATTTINKTASEVLSCAGFTVTAAVAGNVNLTITGGTWSGTANNTISGTISIAGNVTVSGSVHVSGCTLSYASGSITTTGSNLLIDASTTLNTNGISWNNVTIASASSTITINSLLVATGTLTINNGIAIIFAGTAGWTVGTFTISENAARTHTLQNSVTYTITTAFNCFQSKASTIVLITSNDATLKAILTLNNGATCNVLANFTRIDASNGRAIYTFNGTITTCLNIFSFNDALPPAMSRIVQAGGTY